MIIITFNIGGVDFKSEKNSVSFFQLEVLYGNDTSNEKTSLETSLEIELKKLLPMHSNTRATLPVA